MSGIRPFERRVARFHGLELTRTRRHAARVYRRKAPARAMRKKVGAEFHQRHAAVPVRRLSWWKRFLNWLAERMIG